MRAVYTTHNLVKPVSSAIAIGAGARLMRKDRLSQPVAHLVHRLRMTGIITRGDLFAAHGRRLREARVPARHLRFGKTST